MKALRLLAPLFLLPLLAVAAERPLKIDRGSTFVDVDVKATVDSFTGRLDAHDTRITVDDAGKIKTAVLTFKFRDLKTGKPTGFDMIHAHTYQQAAYTLAAAAEGFPVVGAKLIRNWSYRHRGAALPSPEGVFLEMPFDLETAGILLDRVRVAVANLRAGKIEFGPGHACTFCRHGGLAACLPEARRRFGF